MNEKEREVIRQLIAACYLHDVINCDTCEEMLNELEEAENE